jgi:small subunit ribosomal protein S5
LTGERIDSAGLNLEERVIDIWRCVAVVKGGRRFSFAAMAVVGNADGIVGAGYGKAREVPTAIEKAVKDAKKHLVRVPLYGTTIPHEVRGKYGSAIVVMIPARPGTGIIAGAAVRAVLESIGVRDVLTKSVERTNNAKNLVKAALEGLTRLRGREQVARLRGVEIDEDPTLAVHKQAKTRADRRPAAVAQQVGAGPSGAQGGNGASAGEGVAAPAQP